MTQDDFYARLTALGYVFTEDQQTEHQRLIKDLRDRDHDWLEIIAILEAAE